MTWADKPNLAPGAYPRGNEQEAIVEQVADLTDPGWVDWASSLTWTNLSGTAPALGNAVIVATYRRPPGSDIIDWRLQITFGSTSTFGAATVYGFGGMPVAAHSTEVGFPVGTAYGLDTGVQEYGGIVKMETSTTFRVLPASNGTDSVANWGTTAPFTWGNTDVFRAAWRTRVA